MSFCLLAVLYSGAQTTFQNYISAYSTAAAGFTVAESITVSMVFGACFTGGRAVAIPLSKKYSARTMVQGSAAGVTLALCAIYMHAEQQYATWSGTALFGATMASVFPSILTLAKQAGMSASTSAHANLLTFASLFLQTTTRLF